MKATEVVSGISFILKSEILTEGRRFGGPIHIVEREFIMCGYEPIRQ